MHVSGISLDLSWFLQFILTLFLIALGLLHIVKNTASKYFAVDDSFDHHPPSPPNMPGRPSADSCAVCGNSTTKNCAGCKAVRYCSANCQRSHWNSGHKQKCKELRLSRMENSMQPISLHCGSRGSEAGPSIGNLNIVKHSKEKILFPYEEFVDLFNWKGPEFPPCGLLNCGNSCFANVVLQCLSHTRPLFAYLLEKGHRRECRKTDWCFLCELQTHVERSSDRRHPFSPLNILSRLPNIGGNLGYGKQEDAHEFMRFAIDTMQSVCLDEFGGEKALHPSTQETTLIQHIFGGQLESQVICTKCNNISKQYENMMDLTVEIHGDAGSLEECLDQFTVREQLHGDNMYKCDGCNDYVMAWKRLTIRRAPNILTIALKRFQSGRFGKLNKRVTFPETLNLSPYMSEAGHGDDIYKLYAVVVHVDMLNASYFGHYICYIKGFCGNWYRIDDCKVTRADLEEVLSQGAYMLLYSRVSARPSCLKPIENSSGEPKTAEVVEEEPSAVQSAECLTLTPSVTTFLGSESVTSDGHSSEEQKTAEVVEEEPSAECSTMAPPMTSALGSGSLPSDDSKPFSDVSCSEMELSSTSHPEGFEKDTMTLDSDPSTSAPMDIEVYGNGHLNVAEESSPVLDADEDRVLSSASETLKPEANSNGSAICESSIQNINGAESSGRELTVSHIGSPLPLVGVGSTSEISMPVQNGMCQKSEISEDSFRSDVILDDVNLAVSSCKPEDRITGNTSLNGGKKLAVKSSIRAKPRPLFARGFLEKPPRRKCLKTDAKCFSDNAQHASSSDLSNGTNALAKSDLVSQNGSLMKEAHSGCSTPVQSLNQQVGSCLENGDVAVSSSSDKVADLHNGDSGASDNMEIDGHPPIEHSANIAADGE